MAPARKKSKLATDEAAPQAAPAQAAGQAQRGSWYTPAWRVKASPVTQSSRETVSVSNGVSSESAGLGDHAARRPSAGISRSFRGGSRKASALAAEPTRVHAVGDAVSVPRDKQRPGAPWDMQTQSAPRDMHMHMQGAGGDEKAKPAEQPLAAQPSSKEEPGHPPLPPEPDMADDDADAETVRARQTSGSWFGWWSRPDGYGSNGDRLDGGAPVEGGRQQEGSPPRPATPHGEAASAQPGAHGEDDAPGRLQPEMSVKCGSARSWFGMWSNTQNQQAAVEEERRKEDEQPPRPEQTQEHEQPPAAEFRPEVTVTVTVTADASKAAKDAKPAAAGQPSTSKDDGQPPKSSGWAFWSKDRPKESSPADPDTQKQIGELAVADTPSQSHPEAAQYNQPPEHHVHLQRSGSLLRRKGRRPECKHMSDDGTTATTPPGPQLQAPAGNPSHPPAETPEGPPAPVLRGKKPQLRPNLISPSFRDTYPKPTPLGYLDSLAHYVGQSLRLVQARKPAFHPFIAEQPHKVKKAIAIGIHGFFPAALLQRVLGQPTGTSIRFANYAADAIKRWCQEHQPHVKDVEVEKVALEGEGLVGDRVNTLWKLLLNWLSHLRQADLILVACHSQGVPVAVMLVAKLIQLGVLSSNARIGLCAMAGINLGPFLEYKSRFFGGSALELFDFCDSKSRVSLAYTDSLEVCLRHGVRITFVGSLDDQLVSLESSLLTPLSHPYVSRAIFIDGRLHTSNFLIHLVTFAAKLRNLGVSDHGLIREISAPLAGSIVGGEGHSRVYDDPAVYRTAVEFALESTDVSPSSVSAAPKHTTAPDEPRTSRDDAASRRSSLAGYPSSVLAANRMRRGSFGSPCSLAPPGIAPIVAPYEAPGAAGSAERNPFVLPWAVRGMLEEDRVKHDATLQAEVQELVREFAEWKPTSKVLKDVRWRLAGIASMV